MGGKRLGGLAIAVLAAACSKSPLPPDYQDLKLDMSLGALREARPGLVADGIGRYVDARSPAAFRVVGDRVVGLRFIVRPPASGPILLEYAKRFEGDAVDGAPYTYKIDGHLLRLFSVSNGVEILYGVDPGPPAQRLAARAAAAAAAQARAEVPTLRLRRTSRRPEASAYPIGATTGSVRVWLLPLAGLSTGAVSLRMIFGDGSATEQPAGLGSTAVLTELAIQRVREEAEAAHVRLQGVVLRASTIFTVRGMAEPVAEVARRLATTIDGLPGREITQEAFDHAYAGSLRRSLGNLLDRVVLEDESLAALFPNSSFTPSPVDRARPPPAIEEVAARAKVFGKAPLTIIAAGPVRRGYARAIARAAGKRPEDRRRRRPRPSLPNRESRPIPDPAVTIDGLWVRADSAGEFAMLRLAEALLRRHAERRLRHTGAVLDAPVAVIGGGQSPACYLMLICAAKSSGAEQLGLAARAALSTLHEAVPQGVAFDALKGEAHSDLVRRLATPDDGAALMTELALAGAQPEWVRLMIERMAAIDAEKFEAYLGEIVQAENTFSVRWGPEG